mmetsp:Transcript_18605/g.54527  ORF Transcript_18605/g.54527 Transcript_18605/m.54527 type:complete len:211 (-) Transcript_18605:2871-3503(-)
MRWRFAALVRSARAEPVPEPRRTISSVLASPAPRSVNSAGAREPRRLPVPPRCAGATSPSPHAAGASSTAADAPEGWPNSFSSSQCTSSTMRPATCSSMRRSSRSRALSALASSSRRAASGRSRKAGALSLARNRARSATSPSSALGTCIMACRKLLLKSAPWLLCPPGCPAPAETLERSWAPDDELSLQVSSSSETMGWSSSTSSSSTP